MTDVTASYPGRRYGMVGLTPHYTAIVNIEHLEYLKACLGDQGLPSDVRECLLLAVSYDQVELTRLLIMHWNCPVDCRNKKQQTPLHIACSKGHLNMIRMLVREFHANLTLCDENDNAPLHEAARCGQTKVVNCLAMEFGYNIRSKGFRGKTILHLACCQGHTELVETLLTQYKLTTELMCKDNDGNIPLHDAAWGGNINIVKLLITKYKSNPSSKGAKGRTILHLACRHGHAELVKSLLTQHNLEAELLSTDEEGNTPLHLAALSGNEMILNYLITNYICRVEIKNHSGQTSLHLACCHGDVKVIETLLTQCGPELLSTCDDAGNIPLHFAALSDNENVVKLLITKYKSNPSSKGANGRTILHLACHHGHAELVETLLTQHNLVAELLSTDIDGNTPLHSAALGGNERVVQLLITKYNCPLNCENNNKETPLHIACNKGHLKLIRLMVIELKADLTQSALHVAARHAPIVAMNNLVEMLSNDPHIETLDNKHSYCVPNHQKYVIGKTCDLPPQVIKNHSVHLPKRVALLFTKYDLKEMSIIRIFIIEYCSEFYFHRWTIDDMLCEQLYYKGVWYGNTQIIDIFLNINSLATTEVLDDRTILNLASQEGYLELIKTLLTQYGIGLLSTDSDGNTPLHYAAWGGREDIVKLYITEYNCPVDVQNNHSQAPLHLACSTDHISIVRMLATEHKTDLCIQENSVDTPLHIAAWYGHTRVVKCLINEFNCHPNTKGFEGRTILHHACHQGHVELVQMLLTVYNLNPSCTDNSGCTPLHHAAHGGSKDIINLLIIEYHCQVDSKSNVHGTPLHLACVGGHIKVVRMLVLEHGANLHSCDGNNDTPLHKAALCGQAAIMKCLINEFDCDPNAKGYKGRTILHHAICKGHMKLIETMLQITINYYGIGPMIVDDNGNTPLHYAALDGKTEVAMLLITKYGSPVNQLNNNNETPLHLACTKGHLTFIRTLVTNYKADINICDMNDHTPLQRAVLSGQAEVVECFIKEFNCCNSLHLACQAGHLELVELLVTDYKLEPLIDDDNGNTPLHYAALGGKTEVATLLITKYGSPVNQLNNNNETPLHLACTKGFLTFIRTLVTNYKADINTCDMNNYTALQRAVLSGETEVVECFFKEFNCSTDAKGTNGCSLLHLACQGGHLELIKQLVTDYKLDPTISDDNGSTPLHYAAMNGQANVVCLLTFEYSCDLNVTGDQGRNLLHYACVNGHDELAWTLISTFNFSLVSADVDGNTPLHLSAKFGQTKCVSMLLYNYHAPVYLRSNSGKSALEVASDVVTKNLIENYLKEEHDRIQYDYKEIQNLSKKKYSGAQRLSRVFVLGNVQSGKSTLIESLKRQGFFSSFNQVSESTVPPHTSGIIPSEYYHKTTGRVLFYDFAGDPEYYSSHSAIMSNVMQSQHGTNICLILVNFQKNDKDILEELGYWFRFISYHCTKLKEKCKILSIGSHIDLIIKSEATRKFALVSEFAEKYLSYASKLPIEVVKSGSDLTINCCKPRSSSCVHSTLNQLVKGASTFRLSEETAILLGLLEKDFKNVVTCKIQTLLSHIMETGVYLPNTADSLYHKVMELHTVGLLLIIESKSGKLEDYLLLLNISVLTNEVHKLLFSKDSAQKFLSSTDSCSASMGILPQAYLNSILPKYITTECLIQLQYCQEFSHAEVKLDYSVITSKDFCAPRLLYFPALCQTDRKKSIKTPDNYDYSIGWYIKCIGDFDYLPPRFLYVLLVRLAHTLALPAADGQLFSNLQHATTETTVHLYNRRCTMWKNGIHWLMEEGVECYIEMVNNSTGIVIITKSEEAHKSMCTEILFKIIQEIHQAKEEFCGTVTLQEYLIDSNDPTAFTKEDKLFSTCDIARVLQKGKSYVVSASGQGHTQLNAAKMSHLLKYVHWDAENNKGTLAPIEDIPSAAPEQITCTKLCEQNHSVLYAKLTEHSAKWREIGTHLGFRPSELDEIQARPSLYATAPKSLLSAMLAEWLQWSPEDQRGSTKCATLEGLSDALNKAGLSEPAQLIMILDLTT